MSKLNGNAADHQFDSAHVEAANARFLGYDYAEGPDGRVTTQRRSDQTPRQRLRETVWRKRREAYEAARAAEVAKRRSMVADQLARLFVDARDRDVTMGMTLAEFFVMSGFDPKEIADLAWGRCRD